MKERPILFSGEMVRAILDGRKTQTRRIVRKQPPPHAGDIVESSKYPGEWLYYLDDVFHSESFFCPYGVPGDRLWVRETWDFRPWSEPGKPTQVNVSYGADGAQKLFDAPITWNPMLYSYERWRPSIHMPRWASRLTLEVINVRVERLQDVSEEDAKAEGYPEFKESPAPSPTTWFWQLWGGINGVESWERNDWVWVVEFQQTTAQD